MKPMRLDRILSETGTASRRESKLLLKAGRVLVDGVPCTKGEEKFDPEAVTITVDGQPVRYQQYRCFMLHKPGGLVSATEDPREKTVLDLLPEGQRRGLFPVGRLDKDTEGLLLLTDDGALGHRLTSPRHHVDKVYLVRVRGRLVPEDGETLAAGLELGDGFHCLPAELTILEAGEEESLGQITLREGKYHQVKRMMAARGKPVLYLKRLSMGPLVLDESLAPGEYRPLTEAEWEALRRATE